MQAGSSRFGKTIGQTGKNPDSLHQVNIFRRCVCATSKPSFKPVQTTPPVSRGGRRVGCSPSADFACMDSNGFARQMTMTPWSRSVRYFVIGSGATAKSNSVFPDTEDRYGKRWPYL
jgi:hypothetical protein